MGSSFHSQRVQQKYEVASSTTLQVHSKTTKYFFLKKVGHKAGHYCRALSGALEVNFGVSLRRQASDTNRR